MRRLSRWSEAGNAALAAGLSFLFGALVLRPWKGALDVPYLYVGDANLYQASIKGVLEHGWYWHNPSLGAPGEAQLFDFPSLGGDPLNVLIFKFIGLFSSDSAVVINVFFLLTFPLVGLAAYLVLRRLTLSPDGRDRVLDPLRAAAVPLPARRGASAAVGVLRGAARSVVGAFGARGPAAVRDAACGSGDGCAVRGDRVRVGLVLLLGVHDGARRVGGCAARGGDAELAAARARRSGGRGDRGAVARNARAVLRLLGGERDESGVAHRADVRVGAVRAEVRAARAADRASPDRGARGARREVRQLVSADRGDGGHASGDRCDARLRRVARVVPPAARVSRAPARFALYGNAALAALLALLFAWVGGLAIFVAAVQPQIRSWNRLSVFIGFFALLAVGLVLDRLVGGCGRGGGARCSGPGSSSPC